MAHRPTLTTTTAAVACGLAAATLLLTACGGGSDDDASKIKSSPTSAAPAPTATPSATATTQDANAPVFDFPKDVTVEIKMSMTGDKVKDAVLRDHSYAIQAIQLAYVKQNPALPVFLKYTTGGGQSSWATDIKSYRDQNETITGHLHFYDFKVTLTDATTAGVSYCDDQRDSFDKNTKTGKVDRNAPSANSFVQWADLMKQAADGTWKVSRSIMKRGASECRR